uniref:Uncharacterized protein n=1 Tax=Siphoviridae sp. ctBrh2 TaxID=2827804 RepID=A0A8S5S7G9_9CAUD|nr:MAG TPA: hypothetical protein [Siphoviridae sp. ctBrh2]
MILCTNIDGGQLSKLNIKRQEKHIAILTARHKKRFIKYGFVQGDSDL